MMHDQPWLYPEIMKEWWDHSWGHPAIVDKEGHFIKVSPGFAEITGRTPVEMIGVKWQEITHSRDIAFDEANCQLTKEGDQSGYKMRKRYKHKRGHWVPIWLYVIPIRDDDGSFLFFLSQIVKETINPAIPISKDNNDDEAKNLQEKVQRYISKNWKRVLVVVVAVGGFLLQARDSQLDLMRAQEQNKQVLETLQKDLLEVHKDMRRILERVSKLEGGQ